MNTPEIPIRNRKFYMTRGAVAASLGLLVLMMLVGVGNLWATYSLDQSSRQRLCDAFAQFITKPEPPINTPIKQRQEEQFNRLVEFDHKIGCRPPA